MLKKVLVALVCLEIILVTVLRHTPANATSPVNSSYFWDFAHASSTQLVCKRMSLRPSNKTFATAPDKQQMKTFTRTVADSYCEGLTKPLHRGR